MGGVGGPINAGLLYSISHAGDFCTHFMLVGIKNNNSSLTFVHIKRAQSQCIAESEGFTAESEL